jgi:fructokinase
MPAVPLPRFVVFGEALTDLIRQDDGERWLARPGGSPWNLARVAARLGVETGFAGAVSRDVFGDEIRGRSREAGLDLRFLQQVEHSPLLAFVSSTAPPRYFFVGNDSADLHLDPERLPPGWLDAARVVHFGSISLAREPLATRLVALAERCRAAGVRITFDPNHRTAMGASYGTTFERMVRLADVVKLSDDDLAALLPGRAATDGLASLRAWNPDALVLFTTGESGMRLLTPAATHVQAAFPVVVADTVGAGDACLGGWVASWLERPEAPLPAHLAFAAATAAVACRHAGAYAPTRAEVDDVLAHP